MNTPEAVAMRRRILEEEAVQKEIETFQQLGSFRYPIDSICRRRDPVVPKRLESLEATSRFATNEEMQQLWERTKEVSPDGRIEVFSFEIDEDFQLQMNITRVLKFPSH